MSARNDMFADRGIFRLFDNLLSDEPEKLLGAFGPAGSKEREKGRHSFPRPKCLTALFFVSFYYQCSALRKINCGSSSSLALAIKRKTGAAPC